MRWLVAVLLVAGCGEETTRALPPLHGEFAGCADVHRGPVCLLSGEDRSVVIWVDVPEGTPIEVRSNGEPVRISQAFVEGGVQARFEVPRGSTEIVLEAFASEGAMGAMTLGIGEAIAPRALEHAEELRARGSFDAAEEAARPVLEDPDAGARARALSFLGRLALSRGDTRRAIAHLERASEQHHARGTVSAATNDALARAHTLAREHWDFEGADAALDRAEERSDGFPEGHARIPYYRGLFELEVGDYRAALGHARESRQMSARLGMSRLHGLAVQLEASVFHSLGRFAEATDRLESVRRSALASSDGCERADYLTNVGWARIVEAEGDRGSIAVRSEGRRDPREPLRAALREYRSSCSRSSDVGNAELNLALAALQRDELDEARRHLARARAALPDRSATVEAWAAEIEGRILLRDGRLDDAVDAYDALVARARAGSSPEVEWRARLGRARALVAATRIDEATAELERAEDVLAQLTLRIAMGDGRDSFSGGHDASARLLVDLLLDRDPERASRAARRARRRALSSLRRTQRLARLDDADRRRWSEAVSAYWRARTESEQTALDAWRAPVEELESLAEAETAKRAELAVLLDRAFAVLSPIDDAVFETPSPGEVWLLYFPTVDGWAGIAITDGGVRATRLTFATERSPERSSTDLLSPFRREIDSASQIAVISYGVVDEVDFGLLPWSGGALVDAAPVVYATDIGSREHDRSDARRGGAVVVADPQGDLPAAAAEGDEVTALLAEGGAPVELLARDAARPDRVREALARASVLHFAGHGRHAGRGSWESSLPLAGDAALTLGDVLALPRAPDEVVLSACEAGRTDDLASGAPGVSLARAFIAAGSARVVAAVRPVPDPVAARFARAYHRARRDQPPVEAYRIAVLALRDTDPEHASTYRMFVP